MGFCGNSKTKEIPSWLYDESEENICAFLNGCMSGDGTVMLRNNKPMIRYSSISEKLIDDIRLLFFKVGISTAKSKDNKSNELRYKYCNLKIQ